MTALPRVSMHGRTAIPRGEGRSDDRNHVQGIAQVRRIDFATASIFGTFIMLGLGVLVIASLSPAARKASWRFFASALAPIAAGGLR